MTRFPIVFKNESFWAWTLSSEGRKQAKLTTSSIVVTTLVCDWKKKEEKYIVNFKV